MRQLCLLFVVFSLHSACCATDIRIRNDSAVDFENVVVGSKNYGSIKAGDATPYQYWQQAYRYSNVTLRAGSKEFKLQPFDYVGETPLGDGKFTYSLTLGTGTRVQLRLLQDAR